MQNGILFYGNQSTFSRQYLKDHLATNTALNRICNPKVSTPLKSLQQKIQAEKLQYFSCETEI